MMNQVNPDFRDDRLFMKLADTVITHPEYQRLRAFKHHHGSVYDHSLDVTWASYRIGRRLGLRLPDLVKGSLLHDFFLYDRRDPEAVIRRHFYNHPKVSYANALKWFGPLTDREADIILLHMWPVAPRFPRYVETYLVATVDKLFALLEFTDEAFDRYYGELEEW